MQIRLNCDLFDSLCRIERNVRLSKVSSHLSISQRCIVCQLSLSRNFIIPAKRSSNPRVVPVGSTFSGQISRSELGLPLRGTNSSSFYGMGWLWMNLSKHAEVREGRTIFQESVVPETRLVSVNAAHSASGPWLDER